MTEKNSGRHNLYTKDESTLPDDGIKSDQGRNHAYIEIDKNNEMGFYLQILSFVNLTYFHFENVIIHDTHLSL